MTDTAAKVLAGVRVLEHGTFITGPAASMLPFKGTPEATTDVVGGRSDWFFAPLSSALPIIRDGKLQALAVSTPMRSAQLPDVPTTVEAGVPGSDYIFWVALVVRTGAIWVDTSTVSPEASSAAARRDAARAVHAAPPGLRQ